MPKFCSKGAQQRLRIERPARDFQHRPLSAPVSQGKRFAAIQPNRQMMRIIIVAATDEREIAVRPQADRDSPVDRAGEDRV